MKKIKLKISKKMKQFNMFLKISGEDHISEYSAQCSYYTILSFIPFIILLITLIQYTNIQQQTLFDAISKIIPSSLACLTSVFLAGNSSSLLLYIK